MSSPVKTRFCPSPTGLMHLGNTRTALFSALYAFGQHGTFLLRIEDTDKLRSKEEFTQQLQDDLHWLGLRWQEGPVCGGAHVPYFQSARQPIYDKFYTQLKDKGLVYPCFCSEQQLAITRKLQLSQGQPPRYSGTCLHLTPDEVQQKIAAGCLPALRLKIPKNQMIIFEDLVKGRQIFNTDDMGDFIIQRQDGTSPFMYCNAIDDALMGVTHVIRGEDHLTNTPRQILILQALELPVPIYAHISLIVGADGSPLSKRHGSKSVHELKEQGYLPLAIINYLARLGHYYEEARFMDISELASRFDTTKLSKSPARFDAAQLQYWQKEAVMQLSDEAFWTWLGVEVHSLVPAEKQDLFVQTVRPNVIFRHEAKIWAEKLFDVKLAFNMETLALLPEASDPFYSAFLEALSLHGVNYTEICNHLKNTLNLKGKALFQPLRLILTNELHGPELGKIIELMGVEFIENRLMYVKKMKVKNHVNDL
jgi:glutamyl-tRNA synthetase